MAVITMIARRCKSDRTVQLRDGLKNCDKTQYMVLNPIEDDQNMLIHLSGYNIKRVQKFKYLRHSI